MLNPYKTQICVLRELGCETGLVIHAKPFGLHLTSLFSLQNKMSTVMMNVLLQLKLWSA